MAQAKRKNTTKPSRLPAVALHRMERTIATLESCFVTEGWHEKWESGPMPKTAADVLAYLRAQAGGARENAAEWAKVIAFVRQCGQSLDWIFDGDPGGLICKAAGNSPQAASLRKDAAAALDNVVKFPNEGATESEIDKLHSEAFCDLESGICDCANMAKIAADMVNDMAIDYVANRELVFAVLGRR
jgi:hypothetical protein